MDRRTFLGTLAASSVSTGLAVVLTERLAHANVADVTKAPSVHLQTLFHVPWGHKKGQLGHSPARESAPLAPGSFSVTPEGRVRVLDTVNDRIVFLDAGGHTERIVPLPVKKGEPRDFVDIRALEKNHTAVVDRVGARVLVLDDRGGIAESFPFSAQPAIGDKGLVTGLVVDSANDFWLETSHHHHVRAKPPKHPGDIVTLSGMPSHDHKHVLAVRLERPHVVAITQASGATVFSRISFPLDVGHVASFDVTGRGGAWVVVETHEERKTAPFDILRTITYACEIDGQGALVRQTTVPPSTDDGEVQHPSRLGEDGRFYAMVRGKKGVTFLAI
jgi:hypothetical protein